MIDKQNTELSGESRLPQTRAELALHYAAQGWPVFPCWWPSVEGDCACGDSSCSSTGKHPIGPLAPQGVKQATTDAATLRSWWEQYPEANLAIATGGGLLVLDLDGPEAEDSLEARERQLGKLPATLEAKTGKGSHRYYRKPSEVTIRNTVGEQGKRGLGPKLDTRADGGYVMAPGSLHSSGALYEWLNPEAEVADLPQAWLDFLEGKRDTRAAAEVVQLPARQAGSTAYGQKALKEELQQLSQVREPGRNHALNSAAFSLGQLVGGGELDRSEVEAELQRVALAIGLPENEIQKVLPRAISDGMAEPRQAPERPQAATVRTLEAAPPPKSGEGNGLRPTTDLGNAERLLDRYSDRLRFCNALGGWQVWDGKRWRRDELGEARRLTGESARAILTEAAEAEDSDQRKEVARWAVRSEHSSRIQAALWQAEALEGFATRAEDWDSHPLLVSVENGLLDLESFELRPHDRDKLITRLAPVTYDPKAKAPSWQKFLEEVLPDAEVRAYVQRVAGLCLVGDRSAQAFWLLVGVGSNGKSTLVETLLSLVGDYGSTTPADTLLQKREGGVPNDLARLRGARMVAAAESGAGKRLNETLIKQLTGGDRISARFLRAEFFEFQPEFSLLLSTNHAPKIHGTDAGIWRRVQVIPFEVSIPDEKQDKRLPDRLKEELPGILLWAAEGYRAYVEAGRQLEPPAAVQAANAEYQLSEDSLGDFLSECVTGPEARVPLGELYEQYKLWAEKSRERAVTKRELNKALVERGFEKRKSGSGWYWLGLALSENLLDQQRSN